MQNGEPSRARAKSVCVPGSLIDLIGGTKAKVPAPPARRASGTAWRQSSPSNPGEPSSPCPLVNPSTDSFCRNSSLAWEGSKTGTPILRGGRDASPSYVSPIQGRAFLSRSTPSRERLRREPSMTMVEEEDSEIAEAAQMLLTAINRKVQEGSKLNSKEEHLLYQTVRLCCTSNVASHCLIGAAHWGCTQCQGSDSRHASPDPQYLRLNSSSPQPPSPNPPCHPKWLRRSSRSSTNSTAVVVPHQLGLEDRSPSSPLSAPGQTGGGLGSSLSRSLNSSNLPVPVHENRSTGSDGEPTTGKRAGLLGVLDLGDIDIMKNASELSEQVNSARSGYSASHKPPLKLRISKQKSVKPRQTALPSAKEMSLVLDTRFDVLSFLERPDDLAPLGAHIFEEFHLLDDFGLDIGLLEDFILTVSECYNDCIYHNFIHAFDVFQTAALMIKTMDDKTLLTPMDKLILLLAALLHDVDHDGHTNAFDTQAHTPWGIFAESVGSASVHEVHHAHCAIELLMGTACFAGMNEQDAQYCIKKVVDLILVTDMSRHGAMSVEFANHTALRAQEQRDSLKELAMKLIIKTADISNVCKPFDISKKWALTVNEEFHRQGDLEKSKGWDVIALFDREQFNLVKGQLGFINFVASAHFKGAVAFDAGWKWMQDQLQSNIQQWHSEAEGP